MILSLFRLTQFGAYGPGKPANCQYILHQTEMPMLHACHMYKELKNAETPDIIRKQCKYDLFPVLVHIYDAFVPWRQYHFKRVKISFLE